ncbi:hypothetical protein CEXT_707671 [Caerostris extrusa]|uniref:Uncharacterized protein n=1 Tax=Caerostris extrusa TaxID=172846 RepID=A0AAV4X1Z5_CAEEX|nr:hypothetical protein CEXT_707671 [Caerostris extrusa]
MRSIEQLANSQHFGTLLHLIVTLAQFECLCQPIRNINGIFALRKLYDEINVQIRSLESLGVNSVSYGLFITCTTNSGHQNSLCNQTKTAIILQKKKNSVNLLNVDPFSGKESPGFPVFFQTIKCKLVSRNEIVNVRFLDIGSAELFTIRGLARRLGLQVKGQEELKNYCLLEKKILSLLSE